MTAPYLSVVIPAFNEAERLSECLEHVSQYLKRRDFSFECLVIDDGSEDGTAQVAESLQDRFARLRVLHNAYNRGKGYSVRRGMLEARGRYVLLTDTDLSTPIEELEKLELYVVDGPYHVAIGSRDVKGSQVEIQQSALRENSGKLFNWLVRRLLKLPFRDTQCGFKLFTAEAATAIFSRVRTEHFSYDVESLLIARILGYEIKEVPVVWRHDEGSKVHYFRDGSRMIFDLFKIWGIWWSGGYSASRAAEA